MQMNIFIIPSWYPSESRPISGAFIREQVEAVASLCPDIRVIVSTWGFDDGAVPLSHPLKAMRALKWRTQQMRDRVVARNGVWEVFNPYLTCPERFPLGAMRRLLKVNRRNHELAISRFGKIDLIHAHVSYPAGHVARTLAREKEIPYVVTEHMGPFPFASMLERNGDVRREIRLALNDAAATVAVSPVLARDIGAFGLPVTKVIPNLVDERRFQPAAPASDKFIFLTLCSISEQKGIGDLIRAISVWNPETDRFEFRIAGEGQMSLEYQKLAERLGVADRIRWLGPIGRKEVPALFSDCHVYVMPSRHETFGIVYAEAIACGKPVIATRCGGPEYIVNEHNGRLVNVGDVKDLAKTMQWMATHWSDFDAKIIRADFETRFSRPAVVGELRNLYQSVLAK